MVVVGMAQIRDGRETREVLGILTSFYHVP
jgi:hypothetical protein